MSPEASIATYGNLLFFSNKINSLIFFNKSAKILFHFWRKEKICKKSSLHQSINYHIAKRYSISSETFHRSFGSRQKILNFSRIKNTIPFSVIKYKKTHSFVRLLLNITRVSASVEADSSIMQFFTSNYIQSAAKIDTFSKYRKQTTARSRIFALSRSLSFDKSSVY